MLNLYIYIVLGLKLALVACMASWLVFGTWKTPMLRLVGAIVGTAATALLFSCLIGELEVEWLVAAFVSLGVVAIMLLVLHALGGRRKTSENEEAQNQFSVTELMVLTTVVAPIVTLGRLMSPSELTAGFFGMIGGVAFCAGLISIVCVACQLKAEQPRWRYIKSLIVAVVLASVVYYVLEATDFNPGDFWAGAIVVAGIGINVGLTWLKIN